MARRLLLAACCIMVLVCFIYTADGASWSSCSRRCSRKCYRKFPHSRGGGIYGIRKFFYRGGNSGYGKVEWGNQQRMICKQACFQELANCRICPFTASCKRCVNGYEFDGDGRCVATTTPPPPETTAEPCKKTGVICESYLVIDRLKVCDGTDDCGENSDENTALCGDTQSTYKCDSAERPVSELCDCKEDCSARTDESGGFKCSKCPVGQYDCGNDGCFPDACPG